MGGLVITLMGGEVILARVEKYLRVNFARKAMGVFKTIKLSSSKTLIVIGRLKHIKQNIVLSQKKKKNTTLRY